MEVITVLLGLPYNDLVFIEHSLTAVLFVLEICCRVLTEKVRKL